MEKTLRKTKRYQLRHKVRILTAASLYDGHDAAINIMRRMLQAAGAEVIHIGHNRSAEEIVRAAIAEDVQAIALTSYQGGHMEFFAYIHDLLDAAGAAHIRIYGGGGGTILPEEIEALHRHGISQIYSPEDGRRMGLTGMIDDLLSGCDLPPLFYLNGQLRVKPSASDPSSLSWRITEAESFSERFSAQRPALERDAERHQTPIVGLTGTGGAGKSSLLDELLERYLRVYPKGRAAILSIDPSRQKTGGALLGDRIRMNALASDRLYMRSMASRAARALPPHAADALLVLRAAGFDVIFFESAGIGQADAEIADHADLTLYVMTPEYGAATQLEKINMLDYADLVAINKSDRRGAEDALRDVRKQYQRNHQHFDQPLEDMPIYATVAAQFNDPGMNKLFQALMERLKLPLPSELRLAASQENHGLIPDARVRYLSEIADTVRNYNQQATAAKEHANQAYVYHETLAQLPKKAPEALRKYLKAQLKAARHKLGDAACETIDNFDTRTESYRSKQATYRVRNKEITVNNYIRTLSGTQLPKVSPPRYSAWGDRLYWCLQENFPGFFPYTAGIFPYRRSEEPAARMFAGEGAPERTNKRFHYLSRGMPYARLSTAFDSVTLYGEDPGKRPDIYGKVGNSGVSIATLDDAKKLYSGFDLCAPQTSVSMTINGPASIICAFFMRAAIDQQCERYLQEQGKLQQITKTVTDRYIEKNLPPPSYALDLPKAHNGLGLALLGTTGAEHIDKETYQRICNETLAAVRGTVQADILKEDQAQNTCIYSTDFSLRLMGDMQAYFIEQDVRNFYSVSISGYHIAEAGANPITQLAFTLANGFTYVEYYMGRGMQVDDFVPNLSFFFSNGLDPEYAVIGRVARRIWAKAMRERYGASPNAQRLKYHIQTSGRSLHAQEIAFNDIRTTLQALYALYDNCNSLHTNAYDEAITTPTEESVRRALAIQHIINQELGTFKSENILEGSFLIEELTDLVEEAVLAEFDRINARGGVFGAMETMYQRAKIQEESLHYETLKSTGKYPIVGVNTFLADKPEEATQPPREVIRATEEEKQRQIKTLETFHQMNKTKARKSLQQLQTAALAGDNLFEILLAITPYCSLGQISQALYAVGGRYRRSM